MRQRWLAILPILSAPMLVGTAIPLGIMGQEVGNAATVPEDTLTFYASALVEIEAIRQETQEALAAPTNKSVEVQAQIRESMAEGIDTVLEAHGLTAEQYMRITFLVSTDPETRRRLDQIMERLSGDSGGPEVT